MFFRISVFRNRPSRLVASCTNLFSFKGMKNVQIVYAFVLLFAAIVAATKVVQIKLGCMISLFTKKVVILQY